MTAFFKCYLKAIIIVQYIFQIETTALQIPVKTELLVPKFLVHLNATVLTDFLVLSVKVRTRLL